MTEIVIPQLDANSESARLVRWEVEDDADVREGDLLCAVETSKALYEVHAEASGRVVRLKDEGDEVPFQEPIGYIAADEAEAGRLRAGDGIGGISSGADAAVEATRKARELAMRHNVDLAKLGVDGIITEEDVEAWLRREGRAVATPAQPGHLPEGLQRVIVIGAGLGAMQAIDILLNQHNVLVVGCLDDNPATEGINIFGVGVLGATSRLEELYREKVFTHAIIAISTSIPARKKFYDEFVRLGIPMANAIDPSVRINRAAVLGGGNIICSHCHIGVAAQIGDNNFISANTSIDHHNIWGSHITTGPNCATSGGVVVGDGVKFGTGVFIQPNLSIGEESIVASGAIIIMSVPARHIVKVKVQTEMVERKGGS